MEKPHKPTLPTSMKAMAISGGELVPATLPIPKPAPGEVLIRVAYVGVNRADILQLAGQYAPPAGASPLLGLEVSGWVAALGAEMQGFAVGEEVCALLSGGGYAQYVTAPVGQVLPLPKGICLKAAASLPEAAATSMMALVVEGGLNAGERVLIHGGSSGVGILMTQIAKSLGAEVFATVGGAKKAALLRALGITAIDHSIAPYVEQVMQYLSSAHLSSISGKERGMEGVDLIIDILGGPQLTNHLGLLRRAGRLVSLAMLEGAEIPQGAKMTRLLTHHLTWRGATLRSRSLAEKAALMALVRAHIWPSLENGSIKPVVDSCFALNDAKKALNRMQERLHMGKILLELAQLDELKH